MQTIKTGIVVVLLMVVCYGAFIALNTPEPDIPDELLSDFDWSSDENDLQNLMSIEMPTGAPRGGADSLPKLSIDLEAPSSRIDLTSNLPTFDSGLTLPSLNPENTSKTASNPNPLSQNNLAVNTESLSATATSDLPAFPALPALGGETIAAADGPAVALGGNPSSAAVMNTSTFDLPPASGQLVSQTRMPDAQMQLPSLDNQGSTGSAPFSESTDKSGDPTLQSPTLPFTTAREQALQQASNGKLRDALHLLSQYYNSPELNHSQHSDLIDILDALSREVIYSKRHLAEPAYTVGPSDTVASITGKYQITPELFAAVNGLGDSKALLPGSQVKVVQGPFRARVSLQRGELTIFLGSLYAGRFPISIGADPNPSPGTFEIVDRRRDRTYYGTGGRVIAANDPRNPYGGYWLNLGQDLCIHGTPEMASSDLQDAGCISLAPLDAADVYNILAQGTQVTITR